MKGNKFAHLGEPSLEDFKEGSVAWVLQRFIEEMNGLDGRPPVKPLGLSHYYSLRSLQRALIGAKTAAELTRGDVIAHCRKRQADNIKPQTVQQDYTYLSGALKYAGAAWDDCEDISDAALAAAKPFLIKHNLICKSTPRTRRPSEDEQARLLALFETHNSRPKNKIDMVKVARWQIASSRRISESCRMEWADWNREAHTMIVRKMKDPKNRNKTKIVALPESAQALLAEWYETRDPRCARILPYNAKSCQARYIKAKHELGIENLRLHDSRRECFTRLIEEDGFSLEEAILVTGHETIAIPQRTYLAMKPELFKFGPKAKRASDAMKALENTAAGFPQTFERVADVKAAIKAAS